MPQSLFSAIIQKLNGKNSHWLFCGGNQGDANFLVGLQKIRHPLQRFIQITNLSKIKQQYNRNIKILEQKHKYEQLSNQKVEVLRLKSGSLVVNNIFNVENWSRVEHHLKLLYLLLGSFIGFESY